MIKKDENSAKKSRKKGSEKEANNVEKIILQAEERQRDFFGKMLDEQRKMDAEERQRDRDFFLQLGTMFTTQDK